MTWSSCPGTPCPSCVGHPVEGGRWDGVGERKGGRGQGIGGIGKGSEEGMKDGGKRGKGKWEDD